MNAKEKLISARVQMQKENPFFSYLVMHLQLVEYKSIPSCAVDGNGRLYYNSEFIDSLSLAELKGLLTHEVMHLALEHNLRIKERQKFVYNIAADVVINDILLQNHFELPKDGILPSNHAVVVLNKTINNIDQKTSEQIYDEIYKQFSKKINEIKKMLKNVHFSDDSNGNKQKSDSKIFLDADVSEGEDAESTEESKKKDWKKIFVEAAVMSKQRGDLPVGIDRYFDTLFDDKLNWRELLYGYLMNALPFDYTWNKPSKKSFSVGIYLPSTVKENLEVIVSIDTSGSISKELLEEFLTGVVGILKSFSAVKIRLITHDIDVHDDYQVDDYAEINNLKYRGGGGTSHIPLYSYIIQKYPDAELLISLTDGYSDFPDSELIRTLFVINKNGRAPPFGECITLS